MVMPEQDSAPMMEDNSTEADDNVSIDTEESIDDLRAKLVKAERDLKSLRGNTRRDQEWRDDISALGRQMSSLQRQMQAIGRSTITGDVDGLEKQLREIDTDVTSEAQQRDFVRYAETHRDRIRDLLDRTDEEGNKILESDDEGVRTILEQFRDAWQDQNSDYRSRQNAIGSAYTSLIELSDERGWQRSREYARRLRTAAPVQTEVGSGLDGIDIQDPISILRAMDEGTIPDDPRKRNEALRAVKRGRL